MKTMLLAGLLLSALANCSTPATEKQIVAEVPKVYSAQEAVTAYLKKTLDDPASYQSAH